MTDLDNHENDGWDMREHQRNWRSWGSWFSWGSPVGLGIWFVLTAGAFWIVMHALG